MDDKQQAAEKQFVEEVGIVFEQTGLARMAGRVLGWLLISDPPHQSTEELTSVLTASKGSISTVTRLLIQIGLIERLSLPGVRHVCFRIRPGALQHLLRKKVEVLTIFRQLAEHGLELTEGKSPVTRQGLENMRDMYAFFEQELPALLERWEQEHKEKQAASEATCQK